MTKLNPSPPANPRSATVPQPLTSDLRSPLTSRWCHTSSITRSQTLALLPQNTLRPGTEPGALPARPLGHREQAGPVAGRAPPALGSGAFRLLYLTRLE